jgi:hypothetical protein
MHGFILFALERYVLSSHDPKIWARIEQYAGIGERPLRDVVYSDEEAMALLEAAAHLKGKSIKTFLEGFGEFLAFPLLARFGAVLYPGWRTIDVLRHAEDCIQKAYRRLGLSSGAFHLYCHEAFASTVVVEYVSPRRLCALAIGLARGIARHFREEIDVTELRCMHSGHESCLLTFRLVNGDQQMKAERRVGAGRGAASRELPVQMASGPVRTRRGKHGGRRSARRSAREFESGPS